MELNLRDFDLGDLTEDISEMFRMRCEQKGLVWKAGARMGERAVRGDDCKLRQVLINLLGNAVKFTDQGQIGLEVEQDGRRYAFSVADTGPGITAAARERIFEPFQQAEEGGIKGGTGLGLAITKRQIELMGGTLALSTAPPMFCSSLPATGCPGGMHRWCWPRSGPCSPPWATSTRSPTSIRRQC